MYVLLLTEHASPSATARAIADMPAVFVHRWMMALMELFANAARIRKRADEEELKFMAADTGVTQTHMRFAAVLTAAACERAPVAVVQSAYHSVWTRASKEAQTTYIHVARALAPACLAVPREVAMDIVPDSLWRFVDWKNELRESACVELGIRIVRNMDEYYRVWAYVPQTTEGAPAKEGVAAKDASAKDASAKDAPAKDAVAAEKPTSKTATFFLSTEERSFSYSLDQLRADEARVADHGVETLGSPLGKRLRTFHHALSHALHTALVSPDSINPPSYARTCQILREDVEEALCDFYKGYRVEEK